MAKTVERPVRFFPLMGGVAARDKINIKDGVILTWIDYSPEGYLNESDVALFTDMDKDGKITTEDAARSTQEILDLLQNNEQIQASTLLSKGFTAAVLNRSLRNDQTNILEIGITASSQEKSSLEWTRTGNKSEKLIRIEKRHAGDLMTSGAVAIIEQSE
jgi:CDP-glycerol glycerophosphotransferase (TagB/SpsB family)